MKHQLSAMNTALAVAVLSTLLIGSLFSHSSQAEESEIRTPGGAFLGKWKFDEIEPESSLLDVPLAGRRLINISAGYIANKSYREIWRFDDSVLIYDKLPRRNQYRAGLISEGNSVSLVCGSDNQRCDNPTAKNVSRNLTIVTYRSPQTGGECAALVYVDTDGSPKIFRGTYGNYFARSITCVLPGVEAEEALARSGHYLSLIKKDGRHIAKLERYDFPKPKKSSGTPSRQGTKDSAYGKAPDNRVCNMATEDDEWQRQQSLQKWVNEARERGLTLKDCERILNAK